MSNWSKFLEQKTSREQKWNIVVVNYNLLNLFWDQTTSYIKHAFHVSKLCTLKEKLNISLFLGNAAHDFNRNKQIARKVKSSNDSVTTVNQD